MYMPIAKINFDYCQAMAIPPTLPKQKTSSSHYSEKVKDQNQLKSLPLYRISSLSSDIKLYVKISLRSAEQQQVTSNGTVSLMMNEGHDFCGHCWLCINNLVLMELEMMVVLNLDNLDKEIMIWGHTSFQRKAYQTSSEIHYCHFEFHWKMDLS